MYLRPGFYLFSLFLPHSLLVFISFSPYISFLPLSHVHADLNLSPSTSISLFLDIPFSFSHVTLFHLHSLSTFLYTLSPSISLLPSIYLFLLFLSLSLASTSRAGGYLNYYMTSTNEWRGHRAWYKPGRSIC